ncbi:MAG: HEAT repeat domain-containing protein [Propioniciclava sp.]
MTNTPTYTTDLLVRQLTSEDLATRFDAASLIGMDGVTGAADALVERLGTETDCQVRERVTWATVRVIDAALPGLLTALESSRPEIRMQAAHVLSKAARPEFAEHLEAVVGDTDAAVAIKGYRAAANTGDPRVIAWLTARLGDGDPHQRDALTNAFVTLGEPAVAALVTALDDDRTAVRAHAAEALGHVAIGTCVAITALRVAAADVDPEVRLVATTALGELGADASDALAALRTSADPRVAAVASALLAA